jgi:uncharacterized protein YndB with AHSA1/START domain
VSGNEDLRSIQVDEFLPYPPERVWQALVDPEMLGRWLMPNDFKPVVGHQFTFQAKPIEAVGFSGAIECEVLDIRPGELLSISWRDAAGGNALDTTVTWRLSPEGRGTRLFLEHAGFDPDDALQQMSRSIMSGGWGGTTLRRLSGLLAELP